MLRSRDPRRRLRSGSHFAPRALLLLLAISGGGYIASEPSARAEGESMPVITAGREKDVLALVRPNQLGADLGGGWKLEDIKITGEFVRVVAKGPTGALAAVRLELPKRKPSTETTPSFAVHRELPMEAGKPTVDPKVLDPLVELIRKNDDGKFWPAKGPTVPKFEAPAHDLGPKADAAGKAGAAAPVKRAGAINLRRLLLGGGLVLILAVLLLGRLRDTGKKPA